MSLAIIGCGYAGRALARRLVARGTRVRATTTDASKLSGLAALGVEPFVFRSGAGPRRPSKASGRSSTSRRPRKT